MDDINGSGALGVAILKDVDTCAKYASSDTLDNFELPLVRLLTTLAAAIAKKT